ncbi:MAG: tRNA (adenosine(37)-N6)-threonylcarbamoyltransferase complex ATPase subunit type 1 TsaE [Burkholderiales bacterium]|nr:tRNA (adenosine(37)-N6)-threonylcarbamoyltransferase complex ATPase subunit type 1 TsaE [Burkholderiales bacterium]
MHPPILETPALAERHLTWPDEAACAQWATQLARQLTTRPGLRDACIELHGDLGAGKTTFTRHLLRALGVSGRIKSPSYAVVEPHEAPGLQAWHFDFYRFSDPREWDDAGFREVFAGPGLKLVEWPQHAAGLLPVPDLRLHIEALGDTGRSVRVQACTPRGLGLLGLPGAERGTDREQHG